MQKDYAYYKVLVLRKTTYGDASRSANCIKIGVCDGDAWPGQA